MSRNNCFLDVCLFFPNNFTFVYVKAINTTKPILAKDDNFWVYKILDQWVKTVDGKILSYWSD